jgi:hypothetical protein
VKTLSAGTPVKSGHYFNLTSWHLHPVENDGEQLPGARDERWIALPLAIAVLAAPLLGAAFLMFMPAIGFYLVARALAQPVLRVFHRSTEQLAATMAPQMMAGEAHLTGAAGGERAEGATTEEKELDALQAEIDERRAPRH